MKSVHLHALLLLFIVSCLALGSYGLLSHTRVERVSNAPTGDPLAAEIQAVVPTEPVTPAQADERPTPPGESHNPAQGSVPASSPTPQAAPAKTPAAPQVVYDGRITGTAIDFDGEPVAGATLTAISNEVAVLAKIEPGSPPALIEAARRELDALLRHSMATATSDRQGRFELTGLDPDATYHIVGYCERLGQGDSWTTVNTGDDVNVWFYALAITPVRITDQHGNPLSDARMLALYPSQSWSRWSALKAEDGKFRIGWQDRQVGVRFAAPGYQLSRAYTRAELEKPDVEVRLQPGLSVEGTVSDQAGKPVSDVDVLIQSYKDPDGKTVKPRQIIWSKTQAGKTDGLGRYRYDSLPPGHYVFQVKFGGDSFPPVRHEVDLDADARLDFQMDTGARTVVEVRDENGDPLPDFGVTINRGDGSYIEDVVRTWTAPGVMECRGLPREQVQVRASCQGCATQTKPLDLTGGEGRVMFVLQQGAMVRGNVVATDGNPMGQIYMRWKAQSGGSEKTKGTFDGSFELGPLAPGTWDVELYSQRDHNTLLGTQTVQLAPGDCQVRLVAPCGRALEIRVDGESDSHTAYVYLRAADAGDWQFYCLSGYRTGNKLLFSALPAGSYEAYADSGDRYRTAISRIEVNEGTASLTLHLKHPDCVRFTSVPAGTKAALAGLQRDDLLIEYDGQPVKSIADMDRLMQAANGREGVALVVLRDGLRVELQAPGGWLGAVAQGAVR